jgi:hypothetical protein
VDVQIGNAPVEGELEGFDEILEHAEKGDQPISQPAGLENHTVSLSQHSYIDSIISRFNFDDAKPVSTPMDPNIPLMKAQSPESLADIAKMKHIPYREAVGSLMYASMGTRPDITFAVSTVAQFLENPGAVHGRL